MESRESIKDFHIEVDKDLLIYVGELRKNGFTSTASAKCLTENNLAGIPEGHMIQYDTLLVCKRLTLKMVLESRLRNMFESLGAMLLLADA